MKGEGRKELNYVGALCRVAREIINLVVIFHVRLVFVFSFFFSLFLKDIDELDFLPRVRTLTCAFLLTTN